MRDQQPQQYKKTIYYRKRHCRHFSDGSPEKAKYQRQRMKRSRQTREVGELFARRLTFPRTSIRLKTICMFREVSGVGVETKQAARDRIRWRTDAVNVLCSIRSDRRFSGVSIPVVCYDRQTVLSTNNGQCMRCVVLLLL